MQNAKLLDDLAQLVEDTLVLPSDMGAVAKQCDTVSDFYDPNANEAQSGDLPEDRPATARASLKTCRVGSSCWGRT